MRKTKTVNLKKFVKELTAYNEKQAAKRLKVLKKAKENVEKR